MPRIAGICLAALVVCGCASSPARHALRPVEADGEGGQSWIYGRDTAVVVNYAPGAQPPKPQAAGAATSGPPLLPRLASAGASPVSPVVQQPLAPVAGWSVCVSSWRNPDAANAALSGLVRSGLGGQVVATRQQPAGLLYRVTTGHFPSRDAARAYAHGELARAGYKSAWALWVQ